jgi:hypothetical protein
MASEEKKSSKTAFAHFSGQNGRRTARKISNSELPGHSWGHVIAEFYLPKEVFPEGKLPSKAQ